MLTKWLLKHKPRSCTQTYLAGDLSKTTLDLLSKRGYQTRNDMLDFLRPSLFGLHSPYLFSDMEKIISKLQEVYEQKQKVLVYGDYDVDGITSTALLYTVLSRLGFQVILHIPDRQEGYGLHQNTIRKAIESDVRLIITVDCGISALEEVKLANNEGIEVIITDHHEPSQIIPQAYAILNPKLQYCPYPFKDLAGVGVAFKLVQAILSAFRGLDHGLSMNGLLDLVALGTIADIVPLVGENRILVYYGLQEMQNTNNMGLRALLENCGLANKVLKAGHISYMIAPRINAAGRMDTAKGALNLLLENDYDYCVELARQLSQENDARRRTEKKILAEAEAMLGDQPLPNVIVLSSPDWHHGVIGIVASRLVERYHRPVFLICEEGREGKGSARGIPEYDVFQEMTQCAELFINYGGHKQAAGFTIAAADIAELRRRLNTSLEDVEETFFQRKIMIDVQVPVQDITKKLLWDIEQMAPFGMGNPNPLLMSQGFAIKEAVVIGKEHNHLKLFLLAEDMVFEALAFNRANEIDYLQKNSKIDIVYCLEMNEFNGEQKLQIIIKDYYVYQDNDYQEIACADEEQKHLPESSYQAKEEMVQGDSCYVKMERGILVGHYKKLQELAAAGDPFLWEPESKSDLEIIKVFEEMGLVSVLGSSPYLICLKKVQQKVDLNSSLRYRWMQG